MFCFSLRSAGTIWRAPELNGIRVMHQSMLTRKREVFVNTSYNKNLPKLVKIGKVMPKMCYIGCGDSIVANYVTTVHEH